MKTAGSLFETEFLKITASDGSTDDIFGTAVSLSGSTLVVGACQDGPGSAYVFYRDFGGPENWGQVTKLTPSDGASNDNFGWSVSISGDTVVVGAFFDDVGANVDQGSAYVYERDYGGPDNWGEVTKLTASDGAGNDRFGWSVSIFGDTIVAGAYGDQIGANAAQGSAYVFERDIGGPDNWGQRKKITALDGLTNDYFGYSVALYVDTLVIGAFGDDIGANNDQGSAYLFERDHGGTDNWGQVTKVMASDGTTFDFLGNSASIYGDTIVVGAWYADVGANSWQGAAYVFERDFGGPDNWGEVKKLWASDGESFDYFGFSVSINLDTIVAGAYYDDVGANTDQGSACVFGRNEGGADNWGQVTNLTGSDSTANDHFGSSVTINGDTIVVGANTDDIGAAADQGSAYIYKQSISFNLPLNEGWNLISLPLVQPDNSIDHVLSSIDTQWDCVQVYNTTDPDPWKTYNTYKPTQLNDLNSLDHRVGFWINITVPGAILTVNGNASTSTQIPLYTGWNLVGYPTLTSRDILNSLAGTGYDRPVEGFDAVDPYRLTQLADTYMMKPGEGYWIHVPADTVWIIDW